MVEMMAVAMVAVAWAHQPVVCCHNQDPDVQCGCELLAFAGEALVLNPVMGLVVDPAFLTGTIVEDPGAGYSSAEASIPALS